MLWCQVLVLHFNFGALYMYRSMGYILKQVRTSCFSRRASALHITEYKVCNLSYPDVVPLLFKYCAPYFQPTSLLVVVFIYFLRGIVLLLIHPCDTNALE